MFRAKVEPYNGSTVLSVYKVLSRKRQVCNGACCSYCTGANEPVVATASLQYRQYKLHWLRQPIPIPVAIPKMYLNSQFWAIYLYAGLVKIITIRQLLRNQCSQRVYLVWTNKTRLVSRWYFVYYVYDSPVLKLIVSKRYLVHRVYRTTCNFWFPCRTC